MRLESFVLPRSCAGDAMSTAPVKSLIDEQLDEAKARAQVRGTITYPVGMRVADLLYPIKADWLKRRPVGARS
ncbi:Prophage PssSM-02, Orf19 [Pseudomonas cannabina pv. alisalensis]|uniref:Prophage PssSM-02, Orf19 n=3 Tax=Pseudomonas cannabina TaxID=86840 RepID=A0AB37QI17_PSECA|nr:Prophage PssSM-02, Orf19 [Pseudomonas cannabina pv. alisalensis]RMN77575.1 Prophage PssSM-02, Orf19 [Pseudomonas cannabina pv. alisalensis]RMN85088.1 Prophage PssSM-02, Orf19 [Pseudomonas cannabina]